MQIEITGTVLVAALGVLLTFVNFLYMRFGVELRLTERITASEIKIGLVWKVVEAQLPHIGLLVKAPTHDRMDVLIDKFTHHETTLAEARELRGLLEQYQAELQADYLQRKSDSAAQGDPAPQDVGRIVATTLLLVMVSLRIQEEETRHQRRSSWWRRMRALFGRE